MPKRRIMAALLASFVGTVVLEAQSPPSATLLVLSKGDHTVSIVDPATLKVLARMPSGPDPHEIVADSEGKRAYISNYGGVGGAYNTITVVDLVGQQTLTAIDLGAVRGPHGLAFAGGKLWFTAETNKVIGSYDPGANRVDWLLGTGQNRTHMIFVSETLKRIVTSNVSSATMSLIDRVTRPGPRGPQEDWEQTVVPVGRGAEGFDVTPDGTEIWAANAQDGTVSVLDAAEKKVVATLDVDVRGANRLKFTPDGSRALVSTLGGPELVIVDTRTHREMKRLKIGRGAAGIQVQPDGARAYVACTPDDSVAVIDLKSLEVAGRIEAGKQPDGLAWARPAVMRGLVGIGAAGLGAFVAVGAGLAAPASPAPPAKTTAAEATGRIVTAAQALVATLDEAGRAKVQFPYDSPQKPKWSNLPTGIFPRAGLRMGDLTASQRTAALALLSAAFSPEGYRKVVEIVHGDEVLRVTPSGRPPGGVKFGEDEYYLAFFGVPSVSAPWMLQFGGHHLGVNLTLAGPRGTLAPSLTGAQPATYSWEGRTVRPLGDENDRAFALMAALDDGQRKQAILGFNVSDLVLGPGQDGRAIQPEGLRASAMSAAQQAMLVDLAREWAGIANDAFAAPRMDEIRAKLPDTYFAWSGPTTPGASAYFRIQGPTLVIEYAPQRSVDHIHTIYRDPTNDYGAGYARP